MSSKIIFLLTLFLFMLFSFFRLHDLSADLPSYFDTGISLTDEGTYLDGPRKKNQIGQWNLPGEWWQSQKLVPLYSFMMQYWFSWWGVSLETGRALSAVFGIVILALSWITGVRLFGIKGGLGLLALVGSSYILTHFNRAAMVETVQISFLWGVLFCLSFRKSVWREFCVGMCLSAILLTKLSGAIALPGLLFWYFFEDKLLGDFKRFIGLLSGSFIPLISTEIFYPGFLIQSFTYCQENFGSLLNYSGSIWHFLHISVRSMYLSREAPMVILFLVGVIKLSRCLEDSRMKPYLWGFLGSLVLSSCVDMAVRRYLLFMPWMYVLAAYGLFDLKKFLSVSCVESKLSKLIGFLSILAAIFITFSGVPMVFGHFNFIPPKYWISLGVFATLVFLVVKYKSFWFQNKLSLIRSSRIRVIFCLAALTLFLCQYCWWATRKTYHTDGALNRIAAHYDSINQTAVVYGNISPMLTLESNALGFFMHDRMGELDQWNIPDSIDLVTYTLPEIGYETPIMKLLMKQYDKKQLLFEFSMFSESTIQRSIGLWHLEK